MATGWIRVRIKATGQVIDMVPAAAGPKLEAGIAELVEETPSLENRMFGALQTAARTVKAAVGI